MQSLVTAGDLKHVDFPLRDEMLVLKIFIEMLMNLMVTGKFLIALIWMAFLQSTMEGNMIIS